MVPHGRGSGVLPPALQDTAEAIPLGTGTCAGRVDHEGRASRAMSRGFGTAKRYLSEVAGTTPGVIQATRVLTCSLGGIAS
jgi:hypothetical protein